MTTAEQRESVCDGMGRAGHLFYCTRRVCVLCALHKFVPGSCTDLPPVYESSPLESPQSLAEGNAKVRLWLDSISQS
jgi:hypothetical protein